MNEGLEGLRVLQCGRGINVEHATKVIARGVQYVPNNGPYAPYYDEEEDEVPPPDQLDDYRPVAVTGPAI